MADHQIDLSTGDFLTPEQAGEFYGESILPAEEMMPMILACYGEKNVVLAAIAMPGDISMQEMLDRTIKTLDQDQPEPLKWIIFGSEAYSRKFPDQASMAGSREPGSLAKQFAEGNPDVMECLIIMGVQREGDGWAIERKFTRTDDTVIWEEPLIRELASGEVTGGIPMILRGAFG